jgi:hypothetical protein
MNGPTEKIPSQIPGVAAAHRTTMSILKTNSIPGHGECDKKGPEAAMEIRTQQTW